MDNLNGQGDTIDDQMGGNIVSTLITVQLLLFSSIQSILSNQYHPV